MTPDTIAEAVYQIGQAAETPNAAWSGGADLGRMLVAQITALNTTYKLLHCASTAEIEHTLAELAGGKMPNHGTVATAALEILRSSRMPVRSDTSVDF